MGDVPLVLGMVHPQRPEAPLRRRCCVSSRHRIIGFSHQTPTDLPTDRAGTFCSSSATVNL